MLAKDAVVLNTFKGLVVLEKYDSLENSGKNTNASRSIASPAAKWVVENVHNANIPAKYARLNLRFEPETG